MSSRGASRDLTAEAIKSGHTLFDQGKFADAEWQYRQALEVYKRTFGSEHEYTLATIHWVAVTLHKQQKYSEAERLFRKALNGRKKVLGRDHEKTLSSKRWLGETLYEQQNYKEAEQILRQAVVGQERTFGRDHQDTLASKYWLGETLYKQQNFKEAEQILRQAVVGQERTLSGDHENTLASKYLLGITLYEQQNFKEAEQIFRQAVIGYERTLGRDHQDTLASKHWLDLAQQKRYKVEKQERTDQEETLTAVRLLQDIHLSSSETPSTNSSSQPTLEDKLGGHFSGAQDRQEPFTDAEILDISKLLKQQNAKWSKVPRTYIVLRIIGHLNYLEHLIGNEFSDYLLPVTERRLPVGLPPSVRSAFVAAQGLVMTKSLDLEKGERGQHCRFKEEEALPFERKEILGSGGFGQVDKVVSLISFKVYARKRVRRSVAFKGPKSNDMKLFIREIEILKRLKHRHIVKFVGSYTDTKYIGLIMSPVAQMNLKDYLNRPGVSNSGELRTFFGCLARALEFLHEQNIRHKDIKPANILIDHGEVLFTDFGLSLDFTDETGSTTMSMVNGMSPRYCAPEVAELEPRNTKSDIWSLGVVFMEMIAVLKGKTVQEMDEFFRQRGSQQAWIRSNIAVLPEFIAELKKTGEFSDNKALRWTQEMLFVEQQQRPTAASLVASIIESSMDGEGSGFCGICCVSEDDDFSDGTDL
jgi:hypothetical protein